MPVGTVIRAIRDQEEKRTTAVPITAIPADRAIGSQIPRTDSRHAKTPLKAGFRMAVPVGFEPTEGVNPHTLSRRAPLAARTRHRRLDYLQKHIIEKPRRQLNPAEHYATAEQPPKQSQLPTPSQQGPQSSRGSD